MLQLANKTNVKGIVKERQYLIKILRDWHVLIEVLSAKCIFSSLLPAAQHLVPLKVFLNLKVSKKNEELWLTNITLALLAQRCQWGGSWLKEMNLSSHNPNRFSTPNYNYLCIMQEFILHKWFKMKY